MQNIRQINDFWSIVEKIGPCEYDTHVCLVYENDIVYVYLCNVLYDRGLFQCLIKVLFLRFRKVLKPWDSIRSVIWLVSRQLLLRRLENLMASEISIIRRLICYWDRTFSLFKLKEQFSCKILDISRLLGYCSNILRAGSLSENVKRYWHFLSCRNICLA